MGPGLDNYAYRLRMSAAVSVLLQMLPRLRYLANYSIWESWHGAGLHRGVPNEVACVKNLIQVALPGVEAAWLHDLRKAGISATLQGVVCHGHPWVRYSGATARCELGDFLLVHDHRPAPALLQRRAVLVQAKVFHREGVRAKNPVQLDLYRRWPRFTYDSWPGGLGNLDCVHAQAGLKDPLPVRRERELTFTGGRPRPPASPNMLDGGCRYGMIDAEHSRWGDPLNGMNPWRLCCPPKRRAAETGAITLRTFLHFLFFGRSEPRRSARLEIDKANGPFGRFGPVVTPSANDRYLRKAVVRDRDGKPVRDQVGTLVT
jgi:hypothetical protein